MIAYLGRNHDLDCLVLSAALFAWRQRHPRHRSRLASAFRQSFLARSQKKTLTCLAAKFSMARIPVFEEMNAKYA